MDRDAVEHRRISRDSRRALLKRRSTMSYVVRSTAKRLAECSDLDLCEKLKMPCGENAPDQRRPHLERDLRNMLRGTRASNNYKDSNPHHPRRPREPRAPPKDERAEGQDLARSNVPLPSDRARPVPARGKVRVVGQPPAGDAQVAQLYGMGLLYDDGDDDGDKVHGNEVFDLNSIPHEEPVYTIRPARSAKRTRKNKMHLGLSYTDLGDKVVGAPLRVVYDVGGAGALFDVETSQPPDLVSDLLSDYDCFSETEFDDGPREREVEEAASNLPCATWIILG